MNIAVRKLKELGRTHNNSELARQIGVTPGFIGHVLKGRKRPGPKVLAYLGLESYEAYRRSKGSGANAVGCSEPDSGA